MPLSRRDNLTLKSSVAVTCSPTVDVAATTGFGERFLGPKSLHLLDCAASLV